VFAKCDSDGMATHPALSFPLRVARALGESTEGQEKHVIDAIVMAGGKISQQMQAATGATNRALVELSPGRTMLDYILDALRGAKSVGAIYVVGDVPAQAGIEIVAPGETLVDNLMRGLESAKSPKGSQALLVSADIPFISSAAIDEFVDLAAPERADLCYPIIPMDDYRREFAGMKRTTLDIAEGQFTGGNIMLVNPERLLANRDVIQSSYAARKDVFALGRMLGAGLLMRIILSRLGMPSVLRLPALEAAVARLLGPDARVKAIVTRHPSIGTDVDNPEDVEFARQWLARKATGYQSPS